NLVLFPFFFAEQTKQPRLLKAADVLRDDPRADPLFRVVVTATFSSFPSHRLCYVNRGAPLCAVSGYFSHIRIPRSISPPMHDLPGVLRRREQFDRFHLDAPGPVVRLHLTKNYVARADRDHVEDAQGSRGARAAVAHGFQNLDTFSFVPIAFGFAVHIPISSYTSQLSARL